MFFQYLKIFLVLFGVAGCTHGPTMISNWSELDGQPRMLCTKIVPFTDKQSLYIKNLHFVQDGSEEFILVRHLTRTGVLESKIGRYNGLEKESEWIYSTQKSSLGFLTKKEFVEANLTGIFHIRDHQKFPILNTHFEILPEVVSISRNRFVVVDGREVSVWLRSTRGSFELEKKVLGVITWRYFGQGVHFVAKEGSAFRAFIADSVGIESRQVASQESYLVRSMGQVTVYEVASGELQEKPSIRRGAEKKTWDIGYLLGIPAGPDFFIQRWVDGESRVQRLGAPGFLLEDMGVLPAQWWVKSILNDPQGGFRFVVEADKSWYLCQKGLK
ncbi:MAG: hypothetical protein WCI18_13010 [Pseudomonadota bacterium]